MKHKPQSLTSRPLFGSLALPAAIAVILSIAPVSLTADEDQTAEPSASQPAKPALKRSTMTAADVFGKVKDKLDSLDGFSCDIRQTALMTGHRLHAKGRYYHASGNRLRLEYRLFPIRSSRASDREYLSIDSEGEDTTELKPTGSLTQVSDGSVLWSYWINAGQKQLTRRNIREIMEAADAQPNYSSAASLSDLGVGGMQTLMAQLQVGMEFGAVMEQESQRGKLLLLTGRWNEKTKTEIFKLPPDATGPMPEYIPDYVRVYITAATMTPARIQYVKRHPNPELKQVRPLTTLDFVNFKAESSLPASVFEFERPDDEEITEVDLTSSVLEAIKKAASPDSESEDGDEADAGAGGGSKPPEDSAGQ